MLKPSLYDYSVPYIFVKGAITITGDRADDVANQLDERDKGVTFKNCVPFTDSIREINNTQLDNANGIDVVMPMYNLIEYIDIWNLWQYYRDELTSAIVNSESLKSRKKITGKNSTDSNTKIVEIAASLKYLSNFWRTFDMPLISCETNLILTWSTDCVIFSTTG